jgi:hypothetical protein
MEVAFENGQLYFAYNSDWNARLFHEVVRFKGQRSGSSEKSKDDQVDSLSQLVATFLRKDSGEPTVQTPQQVEFEQEMYRQILIRGNYNRIFGNPEQSMPSGSVFTPPPDDESNPFDRAGFKRFGFTRAA